MRLLFATSLSLALWFVASGCSDHDSEAVPVAESSTSWSLSYEEFLETETRVYPWDTTLDRARMDIRLRNFVDGSIRIRVFDGDGFPILDEEYFHLHGHGTHDDEFETFELTLPGVAGTWQIRTDGFAFTGHLYLSLTAP